MPTPTASLLAPVLAAALLYTPIPARAAAARASAAPLELSEILVVRDGQADLSPRVRELAGRRVRVRGWLVIFEAPVEDGFWLAPLPVFQDESGAGSGDLPPSTVRVRAPASVLRALPDGSVPLQVVGRLEVGRQHDAEGRSSLVRLVVEDPRDVARLSPPAR